MVISRVEVPNGFCEIAFGRDVCGLPVVVRVSYRVGWRKRKALFDLLTITFNAVHTLRAERLAYPMPQEVEGTCST